MLAISWANSNETTLSTVTEPGQFVDAPTTVVDPGQAVAADSPPFALPAEPIAVTTSVAPSTTSTTTTTTTTTIANSRPVPDVTELEVNEAILTLFEWNLQFERENEPSDLVAEGFVIETSPAAGTTVGPNSIVTLVVSEGPGPAALDGA